MEDGFEGDKTGGSSPGERWWESELRHWQYRRRGGNGLEKKENHGFKGFSSCMIKPSLNLKWVEGEGERDILEKCCFMTEAAG